MKFDLGSNTTHSPDASRRKDDAKRSDPSDKTNSDTETSDNRKHRRRKRKGKDREESRRDDPDLMHDPHERRSRDDRDNDSDGTVDLPPRFDEQGNRKPGEDDLAAKINDLLSGKGGAGGIFKSIAGEFLGGQGGGGESDGESKSRRRHRRGWICCNDFRLLLATSIRYTGTLAVESSAVFVVVTCHRLGAWFRPSAAA